MKTVTTEDASHILGAFAMTRYTLTDWHRNGDTLTLMLRRDRSQVPVFTVAWFALSVILFLPVFPLTIILASPPLLMLLHYWLNVRTLRLDADLIVVEDSFLNFKVEFCRRFARRVYIRKDVDCPVPRITFYGMRYDNTTRTNEKHYGYEIRIPFEQSGGRGVIVNFPREREMLDFERIVRRYWDEVPAESTWTEPVEPVSPRRVVEPAPVREDDLQSVRDFSLDRGDGTVAHAIPRKEPNSQRSPNKEPDAQRSPNNEPDAQRSGASGPPGKTSKRSLRPMVTIFEKRGDVHGEWMLKLVSERNGPVSTFLGRASYWCYNIASTLVFFAVLGVCILFGIYHEPVTETVSKIVASPPFQEFVLPALFTGDVLEAIQESFLNFADADLSERVVGCGLFVFVAIFLLPLFMTLILGSLIRWPFWKRWTVCFRNTLWRPTTMTGDWSDDRMAHRGNRMSYTPFCAAIPGRPGMHRLLTGRSMFDRNPGWRTPCQVVIITAEGSFPLPVADEKEQQRVIRTINEFTVGGSERVGGSEQVNK